MRRTYLITFLLLALLAGCAGGGGSSPSDPPATITPISIASAPPLPTCGVGTTNAPLNCSCPVNHLQGNGSCVIDGPGSTSATPPTVPPPVLAAIGSVTSNGLWTYSGGVCLAWIAPDGSEAPFICGDTLDYSALVTGQYMSKDASGLWTSPQGNVRGPVWAWPLASDGTLTGARQTLGQYPLVPDVNQASGDLYPGMWALSFCETSSCSGGIVEPTAIPFSMVPTSMNGFAPAKSLTGVWPAAYCQRIACGLSIDATGTLSAQDSAGCIYSGTLTGALTSVAQATITDCTGTVYTGAGVVIPQQVGPNTYVDWSTSYVVILAAAGSNGELVISNAGAPRVPQ